MAGVAVNEVGCPLPMPGDMDGDGDVDQTDFGYLQVCMKGPGVPRTDEACARALLDDDDDVDMNDFAVMQQCFSGANIPADLTCAD